MEEKREFRWKKALDLFEKMYFRGDEKDPADISSLNFMRDNTEYYRKNGRIKEKGRSIFTPRMFPLKDSDGIEHIYLTMDVAPEFAPSEYPRLYTGPVDFARLIDITNQTKEEILNQVASILSMSNGDIMQKFGVRSGSISGITELLIVDKIWDYTEGLGLQVHDCYYESGGSIVMKLPEEKTIRMSRESYAFGMYRGPGIQVTGKEGKDIIWFECGYDKVNNDGNDIANIHVDEIRIIDENQSIKTKEGQVAVETLRELTRKKGEHTAEEIGDGIGDLTQGEVKKALNAVTDRDEQGKKQLSIE